MEFRFENEDLGEVSELISSIKAEVATAEKVVREASAENTKSKVLTSIVKEPVVEKPEVKKEIPIKVIEVNPESNRRSIAIN